jgi:hypothetical protein
MPFSCEQILFKLFEKPHLSKDWGLEKMSAYAGSVENGILLIQKKVLC